MNNRTLRRRAAAIAAGTISVLAIGVAGGAHAETEAPELGFTPITTPALHCDATGPIAFAANALGQPIVARTLMSAGDPAYSLGSATPDTVVGDENDMNALSPNGRFLYSVSEAGASKGVTRLTLKGTDAGKKEILATNPAWSRVDGVKWYPYGGPQRQGVLLISEEFAAGGVWQVNPETGAHVRLDWVGNYSHEGIGLDAKGNLYLGDENRAGGIYKAVPKDPADLTKGGTLYFLVKDTVDPSGWKQVVNPANATAEAQAAGVLFDRPEDFDEANGRIYFTVTEPKADADRRTINGNKVNRGGIYSFSANGTPELSAAASFDANGYLTPMIEVNDPKYTSADQAKAQQGLQFPDNIAFDGHGNLWVHEDIPDGATFPASGIDVSKQVRDQQDELYVFQLNKSGDAIVANPSTEGPAVSGGYKAADMRNSAKATPCENEFTGGIFGRDGKTLFINQQHADNPTVVARFDD